MSSSRKFQNSLMFLSALLFISFFLGGDFIGRAEGQADEPVDCIIIKYNQCPNCVDKYTTYVNPFFVEYQSNDSIDIAFIDASLETTFFFEQMDVYNITVSDYGNFPWVIFVWDDDKSVVLDIEAILQIMT